MRKTTSRIARLPETVREEINQKLDEGWPYKKIREWLFGQMAGQDMPALDLKAGESYAAIWARTSKSAEHAADACEQALSNWYCKRFPDWVKEKKELEKDKAVRSVERMDEIGRAVGEKVASGSIGGANLVIRSLLFEAISNAREGQTDPKEIARLAQAWARVSDAGVEVEKMNLKAKEAIDVGLDALWEDIKDRPEAKEAWENLYNIVKRLEAGGGGAQAAGNS